MGENQLRAILNQEFAKFAGQMFQYFDKRFIELEEKVDSKAEADRVCRTLDGIAKRLNDDAAEHGAMNRQLERHERWHHQAADKLNLKLDC